MLQGTPSGFVQALQLLRPSTPALFSGADDVLDCGVQRGHAEWFLQTGLVQAQLCKNVFVSDDNTVTDAAAGTNDLKVGTLLALSGSEALIHIGVFAALDA